MTRTALLLTLAMVLLPSCQSKEEAEKKCQVFFETLCERRASCLPAAAQPLEHKRCAKLSADCNKTVGWGENHDACIDALKAQPCEDALQNERTPSACDGAILWTE